MSSIKGIIALMGSGELTATMVEVHKEILSRLGDAPKAVFLDTPAGFQLNAEQLSQRATEYFYTRVQHPMSAVSFKSKGISEYAAEEAYRSLKQSDYILVGPGSPTYAVRQWKDTPIPEIISERINNGGCLVAASAAALTVGRLTLPVYEIYKVGEEPYWEEGMNILGSFALNFVVVPHWNNAEGGTHDTRRCFIGESRFNALASLIPEDTGIIGLDEHTACIIDFKREEVVIRGIGSMTILRDGSENIYQRGETFPIEVLYEKLTDLPRKTKTLESSGSKCEAESGEGSFWESVHSIEETFHRGLEVDPRDATNAVLDLDRTIWKAQQELEDVEFITQARDLLRELIVLLGTRLASSPRSREECLAPLVEKLLTLRDTFRENKQWQGADALRECLSQADITVEDTAEGSRWRLTY